MSLRSVLVVLVFFMLITLPYIQAELSGGADWVFGGFLFNPVDGNSYLAKMYQGWRGEWRFTLPYTAQPGAGAYIFLFYLFLGHLARWIHLSLLMTFHLARLFSALIMVLAVWRFLVVSYFGTCQFTKSAGLGNDPCGAVRPGSCSTLNLDLIFALATLGLGMGWLVFPSGLITSDLWVAETYPFLSAYANPHFTLSLALLLWLLTSPTGGKDKTKMSSGMSRIRLGLFVGLASLLLSVLSPFGVILVLVVLGGLVAWNLGEGYFRGRGRIGGTYTDWLSVLERSSDILNRWAWIFFFGAPLLIYDFWVTRNDPLLAGWNVQNLTLSPPFWDLLLSLMPALLLALVGARALWDNPSRRSRLLLVWAVLGLCLIYLPLGLQRRFMMGFFLPMVGLAGIGLAWMGEKKSRLAGKLGMLVFFLSLPTTLLVLLVGQYGIQMRDPSFYLSRGEVQALEWIEKNTLPDAIILASPETGLFIPAHTGRRVIYGHPFETVNAEVQKQAVIRFFQGAEEDDQFITDFLFQHQVDYVLYGPRERQLGNLARLDDLRLVYSMGSVEVYSVEDRHQVQWQGAFSR